MTISATGSLVCIQELLIAGGSADSSNKETDGWQDKSRSDGGLIGGGIAGFSDVSTKDVGGIRHQTVRNSTH